ncbi:hypothetical protein [Schlesneria sp. DSM 10557]
MSWARSTMPLFALLALCCGCGYSEYEARLNESRKYYAYLDKIEQSLAPKWTVAGNLIELRVPLQFTLIPPAAPIQKEDGTIEQPTIDPRQPDYLNLTFPELFGAWESTFQVGKGNGVTENHKGYIYALSNYWELAGEHATDAGEFVNALKTYLSDRLQIPVTDEAPQLHPKVSPSYQAQAAFDVCSFKGKEIDGTNYTFEVYSKKLGSVIGVLVVVLPEGIENAQKVNERIPLMLESFNFTSVPPKAGADKNAPAQGNPAVVPNAGF